MTTITEIIGRVNTQLVDPMMVRWPLRNCAIITMML